MSDETAVPPPVPGPTTAKKGLSPLAWIAIGVGGLVVVGLIGFLALGVFVFRQGQEVVREATGLESISEVVEELRDAAQTGTLGNNTTEEEATLMTTIEAAAGAAGAAVQDPISIWHTTATSYRGEVGNRYAIDCPPNPDGSHGTVWGSDPYSDDSSICAAGVHAGVVGLERGGIVWIEIEEGQDSYSGSERNRLITSDWGLWPGSFSVLPQ